MRLTVMLVLAIAAGAVGVNAQKTSKPVKPKPPKGFTVLFDGKAIKSCTMLAVQANGHDVTTVEGLATASELHPIQEGFKEEHGLQCGFCTPGMMLAATALLEENPDPTEDEVRWALSGNLCRCTGYQNIIKAVRAAAVTMRDKKQETPAGR